MCGLAVAAPGIETALKKAMVGVLLINGVLVMWSLKSKRCGSRIHRMSWMRVSSGVPRPPCHVFPTITTSCLVPQSSAFHSIGFGSAVTLSPHVAPIGLSHSTVFPCQLVPVPLDCHFEMFAYNSPTSKLNENHLLFHCT